MVLSKWLCSCHYFLSGDRVRYIGSLQSAGIILDGQRYNSLPKIDSICAYHSVNKPFILNEIAGI